MLFRTHGNRQVTQPTHRDTWWLINSGPHKLTPAQFNYIIAGITRDMIGAQVEVKVPGWLAETNWAGLPWEQLFYTAGQDTKLAALMLGSMAQFAFISHPAVWYTGQTVYRGRDVPNTYYFQKKGEEERDD